VPKLPHFNLVATNTGYTLSNDKVAAASSP
jgi:hypothetical protein